MIKIAPFKSEAQRKLFYAKESRGELPKGTAARWEKHTPKGKLPEHVKESGLRSILKAVWSPGAAIATRKAKNILSPIDMIKSVGRKNYFSATGSIKKDTEIYNDMTKKTFQRGKNIDIAARIGYGVAGVGGATAIAKGMMKKQSSLAESFTKIARGLKKLPPVPKAILEQQEAQMIMAQKRKGLNPAAARVGQTAKIN